MIRDRERDHILLAAYVVAVCGYVVARLIVSPSSAPILLGSWILVSLSTIALLGAVSPLTLLLNLRFR